MGSPTDVLAPAPPRSRGLISRVVPPSILGRRRALLLIERDLMVYRRQWMIVISGLFEPLFYLLSIGVGIGKLVGDVHGGGQAVSYSAFVAPALMASSAMNGAIYESTMNVFFKLKYAKVYEAVLATPVSVADVALGEVGYALLRGGAYAVVFLCVMLAMGLVASWWAVLAVPAAILIGFAFAGAGLAATSYMKSWQDFDLVQLAILPLFLFSAPSTRCRPTRGVSGCSCASRPSTRGSRSSVASRWATSDPPRWGTCSTSRSWVPSACASPPVAWAGCCSPDRPRRPSTRLGSDPGTVAA